MKIKLAALTLSACLVLFGCQSVQSEVGTDYSSMFVEVEWTSNWSVVYHRDTKVMYAVSDGMYNRGTFTLLVNPDGTPMLWE